MRSSEPESPILTRQGQPLGMTIGQYDRGRKPGAIEPVHALCLAPFTAIDFGPDGTVTVCNHFNHWIARLGENDSFLEIWRGPEFQKLRDDMQNYVVDEDRCRHCVRHIRAGNPRQAFAALQFDEFPARSAQADFPDYLIFRLSNHCNLACVMCDEYFSSVIRDRRENLPPLPRHYGERFFAELREILPRARYVEFYGGEPFLVEEHRRIFRMIEETQATCGIYVNTNGTSLNAEAKRWIERLNFRVIAVSMDASHAALHARTRIGIQHDVLWRNFRWFLELREAKRFTLALNVTELRQNWFDLPQMYRLAAEVACPLHINTCIWPPHCSLYTLPTDQLQFVQDYLLRQRDRLADALSVCDNHQSYHLLLSMIAEELARRSSALRVPCEVPVSSQRYGTDGRLAAIMPGYAPFDTPEAVLEEIERTLQCNPAGRERLLWEMRGHLEALPTDERWAPVRARLRLLASQPWLVPLPVRSETTPLGLQLSPSVAQQKLRRLLGNVLIDRVDVDSLGLIVAPTAAGQAFLGIPIGPLVGQPLSHLEETVRKRLGPWQAGPTVHTSGFVQQVIHLDHEGPARYLASLALPRWSPGGSLQGTVLLAGRSASLDHAEVAPADYFFDLLPAADAQRLPGTTPSRAVVLARSLPSDAAVLHVECDLDGTIITVDGAPPAGLVVEHFAMVGTNWAKWLRQLDLQFSDDADHSVWQPRGWDQLAQQKGAGQPSQAFRVLTLPEFDAQGRLKRTVCFLTAVPLGTRLRSRETLFRYLSQLALLFDPGEAAEYERMSPQRVALRLARHFPDGTLGRLETDFSGRVVRSEGERFLGHEAADLVGRLLPDCFDRVAAGWQAQIITQQEDTAGFLRRRFEFDHAGQHAHAELYAYVTADGEGCPSGFTLQAVRSDQPPRTGHWLEFDDRAFCPSAPADERAREERARMTLAEGGGTPLAAMRCDAEDRITSVERLPGSESPLDLSAAVGQPVDTLHGALIAAFGAQMSLVWDRKPDWLHELALRCENTAGQATWVRILKLPIWDASGIPVGVTLFVGTMPEPPQ